MQVCDWHDSLTSYVHVVDDTLLPLFSLPVKVAGIGMLSPSTELPLNHATSVNSTLHLKQTILQVHPFNLEDHNKRMDNGRPEEQKSKAENMRLFLLK
eukprot:4517987-Ditylum_brightwellii.AAC.1